MRIAVDFAGGANAVSGTLDDVWYPLYDPKPPSFAMTFHANLNGSTFSSTDATATGLSRTITGTVQGGLYGLQPNAASEVGGVFSLGGADLAIVGGFVGGH